MNEIIERVYQNAAQFRGQQASQDLGADGGSPHGINLQDFASDLINAFQRPEPPAEQEETGFFTDTTLCIGCKACEVACKQWNQLPADGFNWTGNSYDNTVALSDTTWRHVAFIEQFSGNGLPGRWLMMSDVCKHCQFAPCIEVCPTGALIYNEFGNVYVQQDICNGCANCVVACPFGVLSRNKEDGRAHKCTLCYDRQKENLVPACAKACPTESIKFGTVSQVREEAQKRIEELHARGESDAYLYGAEPGGEYSALNSFFLLKDRPSVYNLPEEPRRPSAHLKKNYLFSFAAAIGLTLASALFFGGEDH
jgi:formate dehydrogenase iron-sulfur subunit